MRSRPIRFVLAALGLIAVGTAASIVFQSEKLLASKRAAFRGFDLRAREAADACRELQSGQQAYVASGQSATYWMPSVAATVDRLTDTLDALHESARTSDGQAAIDAAIEAVRRFSAIDKQARDYLKAEL